MATILYKDGVAHRIQTHRVRICLENGYSVTPIAEKPADDADLQAAREMYEEKFGKKPHHKKTLETLYKELGLSDD